MPFVRPLPPPLDGLFFFPINEGAFPDWFAAFPSSLCGKLEGRFGSFPFLIDSQCLFPLSGRPLASTMFFGERLEFFFLNQNHRALLVHDPQFAFNKTPGLPGWQKNAFLDLTAT